MRPEPPAESEERYLKRELHAYEMELEARSEALRAAHVSLDAARARYTDLFNGAPVALVTVGLQGRILAYNQRAARMLQLRQEMAGRSRLTDFMSAASVARYEEQRARLLETGHAVSLEIPFRRGTEIVWAELTMNLAREESGGTLVCQIALVDVTERKRMQEEVAHLAAIVTSAHQAILSEDLDGVIRTWNASAERLFGYSSSEAIGHAIEMLIPADCLREAESIRVRVRSGETHAYETKRVRRGGVAFPVFIALAPILDAAGRVSGVSHVVQDIGSEVESRQQVQRLLHDLKEADQRKDTFIATLAHELRNPLAPIRNAATILRFAPDLDPKLQWCRDVIDRQVRHMGALLEDLLDVSRLTRDKITLRWDRVEIGTVILQAVETARPLLEGRGHKLTLDLPAESLEVDGDLTRLVQVFGNLLSNAAKYTDPGGEISVRAERRDGEVVVRVIDNGVGIDPSELDRVFELFSQLRPGGTASDGGLGLGLALVKGLVERHHGAVVAESAGPGTGSTFVVTLPLAAARSRQSFYRGAPEQRPDAAVDHSQRLLVVDDNVDVAESMAVILRHEGYEVRTAHDGETAIEIAEAFRPHMVFLDLGMPRVDGYDVARRLRREPWMADAILVACTGWGQPEDRRRSSEAGFDHHLVKPVSPEAVLQLVASSSEPNRE
jgi:PAS domain S-box-containing protein